MRMFLVILSFLFVTTLWAQDAKVKEINKIMKRIGLTMGELLPLMVSEEDFLAAKNQKRIAKDLKQLVTDFEQTRVHFKSSPLTYLLTENIMEDHLKDTLRIFEAGNKDFARISLKSTVNLCLNCHTQDHQRRKLFPPQDRNKFNSDLEYAEFQIMTRQYDSALEVYQQVLMQKDLHTDSIEKILKRKLMIFILTQKSYKEAAASFTTDLANPKLSPFLREELLSWIETFKQWQKSPPVTFKDKEARKKIENLYLKEESEFALAPSKAGLPVLFHLRSVLNDFLLKRPEKKDIPFALYGLSLSERATDVGLFYSLGNTFLKTCIRFYPQDPYARKCYKAYKDSVIFSFTGSAGTDIPSDVQKELEELEKGL